MFSKLTFWHLQHLSLKSIDFLPSGNFSFFSTDSVNGWSEWLCGIWIYIDWTFKFTGDISFSLLVLLSVLHENYPGKSLHYVHSNYWFPLTFPHVLPTGQPVSSWSRSFFYHSPQNDLWSLHLLQHHFFSKIPDIDIFYSCHGWSRDGAAHCHGIWQVHCNL